MFCKFIGIGLALFSYHWFCYLKVPTICEMKVDFVTLSSNNEPQADHSNVDLNSVSVLIPRSKEGDGEARQELLTQIQGYLESIANKKMDASLKQKVGASDIVQLSFLRVIENFEKFRGGTAAEFHSWLKTIVTNEINNTRRTFHAKKRDVTREKNVANHSPSDDHLTPSSEAMQSERVELFHSILAQLSDEHAEVIRLRNIDQLPFKQIAEAMDRSEDAVAKLWQRAMLKFEEKLSSDGNFKSW
jgi:RNA polymerase sigma-70 factor (ECF subfamily)